MSYADDAAMRQDSDLRTRLVSCATKEGVASPEQWVNDNLGALAASPGWSDKWASGKAARQYTVGNDPAVISDADILAAVQSIATQEAS